MLYKPNKCLYFLLYFLEKMLHINVLCAIASHIYSVLNCCFRNYVVQYILDLKSPLVITNLVSQFKGNYVQLSMQKFSSHVVEKCLKVFDEDDQATIILELLSVSQFEQLLQHPYANYVIQSALQNSKVLNHLPNLVI